MATHSLDELFAAPSRRVQAQFKFFFFDEPTIIDQDNYLIDFEINEQVMDDTSGVLGSPQPSTLDISLSNIKGMFTPSNESGPFAGRIAPGLKIVGEIKVIALGEESAWLPLGCFYVTDWKAPAGSAEVSVYASDCLQSIFDANTSAIEVVENYTYSQFITYFFETIGAPAVMEDTLGTVLPFGWSTGDTKEDLTALTNAARAVCISNRTEQPHIHSLIKQREVRATIDDDCGLLVSATENSSFVQQYAGVNLTYKQPCLAADTAVVTANEMPVVAGEAALDPILFSRTPVYAVESVCCQTKQGLITVTDYVYTPSEITVTLLNSAVEELTTDLCVHGTVVDFTDVELTDEVDDLFSFNNMFIQSSVYAALYKAFLARFISCKLPTLTIEIIGNANFKLLDRIQFNSKKYSMQFDGVIVGIKTAFSSGLSQTLTLLNSSILTDM